MMLRTMQIFAAVWLLAGAGLAFFDGPITEALWIMSAVPWVIHLVLGCVLLLALLYQVVVTRGSREAVISAVGHLVAAVTLFALVPLLNGAGDATIFRVRFAYNRATYERVVEDLRSGRLAKQSGQVDGVRYRVDAGATLRVAFVQRGILDNFEAVVYDPSGAVAAAQGWDDEGVILAPPDVRELFGGDLYYCEPVEGHFYRCWFT